MADPRWLPSPDDLPSKSAAFHGLAMDTSVAPPYSLRQLVLYMLRLGSLGFGGPVALAGYMHRDLVEERKRISDAAYNDGLALPQLMTGPLAARLAMYLA